MTSLIRPALTIFVLLTMITGIAYPLAITGIAQLVFPREASGSLIIRDGKPIGSSLIGQTFTEPRYFWGRPSATAPVPYTSFNHDKSTGSSGSNLGPTNPALIESVRARIGALNAADTAAGYPRASGQRIPADLITSSASGLDPHISLAAAEYQLPRVARARGLTEDRARTLVREHSSPRSLGILGEPVVNVLELNLALDAASR